jgi:hypothetical protein
MPVGDGKRMVSVSRAPKSWTFFWWQEGQNQRLLQEKASRWSFWHPSWPSGLRRDRVVAADAGEAVFQVPAVQELVHHLGDDGPQVAVAGLVAFLVFRRPVDCFRASPAARQSQ